ncbi:hypothetical protein D6833_11460 [Candidatus Parcubacteria bacterium]|nr:MAG: hypothetical protein D6833_11460 [Candidatus Parcubacteria bacterium]
MAVLACHRRVFGLEREAGLGVVVEGDGGPGRLVVAVGAGGAELALVDVVVLVAISTEVLRFAIFRPGFMTVTALQFFPSVCPT